MHRGRWRAGLTRLDVLWGLGLAALVEGATCLLRFAVNLQSTRDTGFLRRFTFGYRVHHSYLGLLLAAVVLGLVEHPPTRRWGFRVGAALLLSDLFHHFVVLWITTGGPQFDLVYPR